MVGASKKNTGKENVMNCKYLILGAGYLGSRFNSFLEDSVLSTARITSATQAIEEITKHNPEIVINCIGRTGSPNIDWCEEHKMETTESNVLVPGYLLQACQILKKRMVHIGSGDIYQGNKGGEGFSEEDEPNFMDNHYARTKISAEKLLKEFPNVLQVRIKMPIDNIPHSKNLLSRLIVYKKIILAENSVTVVSDLLNITKELIERNSNGIFNVVNNGAITHDDILKIYQEITNKKMNYQIISPSELDSISKVRRTNSVLSIKKLESHGIQVPDVKTAVRGCLMQYQKNIESKKKIKGIVLAGGTGSRLLPLTRTTNKHLLPIYNKPMIYYPLETLKAMGITDILIVAGREHCGQILTLLGSGKELGLSLSYEIQEEAGGIAQALGLAREFTGTSSIAVILGDNIFQDIFDISDFKEGAKVFIKYVEDPARFGVAEVSGDTIVSLEEKPKNPKSNYAVTGLYLYDNNVFSIIETLKPSARGELEITDVNNAYIKRNQMSFDIVKGYWTDAGTFESLFRANYLVKNGSHDVLQIA